MMFSRFVFGLACLFLCLSFEPAMSQVSLPLIESYNFDIGNSSGVELSFHDDRLGAGSAEMRFTMEPVPGGHEVRLEVFRHVSPGAVVFALLLERVEITFLNSSGAPIRSVVLDKTLGANGLFIIGDSKDGYFKNQRILRGLGAARKVVIALFGNYE